MDIALRNLEYQCSEISKGRSIKDVGSKQSKNRKSNTRSMEPVDQGFMDYARYIGYDVDCRKDDKDIYYSDDDDFDYMSNQGGYPLVNPKNLISNRNISGGTGSGMGRGKILRSSTENGNFSILPNNNSSILEEDNRQGRNDKVISDQLRQVIGDQVTNQDIEDDFIKKFKVKKSNEVATNAVEKAVKKPVVKEKKSPTPEMHSNGPPKDSKPSSIVFKIRSKEKNNNIPASSAGRNALLNGLLKKEETKKPECESNKRMESDNRSGMSSVSSDSVYSVCSSSSEVQNASDFCPIYDYSVSSSQQSIADSRSSSRSSGGRSNLNSRSSSRSGGYHELNPPDCYTSTPVNKEDIYLKQPGPCFTDILAKRQTDHRPRELKLGDFITSSKPGSKKGSRSASLLSLNPLAGDFIPCPNAKFSLDKDDFPMLRP